MANATLGALLCLLNNPECQERMYRDIEKTIGTSRQPVLADMGKLPYCQAVILEAVRLATHVPIVFPHRYIYIHQYILQFTFLLLIDNILFFWLTDAYDEKACVFFAATEGPNISVHTLANC